MHSVLAAHSSIRATVAYLCLLTPLNCEEQVVSPVGNRGLRRLLVALREPAALPLLDGRLHHCNPSVSLQLSSSTGSSARQSNLLMRCHHVYARVMCCDGMAEYQTAVFIKKASTKPRYTASMLHLCQVSWPDIQVQLAKGTSSLTDCSV